ncbi:MAG: alpha/beta hydrolase-fold protein [Bacteroidota bacterium]
MQKYTIRFCLFLLLFSGDLSLMAQSHPGRFITVEKQFGDSRIDGYNLYIPDLCTKRSKSFPVIVFLQGGLGVGDEVNKIFNWALPKELKEADQSNPELYDLKLKRFVYVMPHISQGQFYENTHALKRILEEVSETWNVDKRRIYLTGLSRGGHGSWGVASRMPDVFAAVAPICGAAHGIENYANLGSLPIWTSHNLADGVVDYQETKETVAKIENLTGKSFYHSQTIAETDYETHDRIFTSGTNESKSHDAWTEMYNDVRFYRWLLRFRKE